MVAFVVVVGAVLFAARALEARPNDSELEPSMSVDMFGKGVQIAKKIVLGKMEKKIAKSSFFLGKAQKIFQQRFNDGTPLAKHANFFTWGVPSVLLVTVYPWIFMLVANKALGAINKSVMGGELNAESVSWGKMLMAGPAFLVVAFVVLFWAVRGLEAIKFLQGYKVKPKAPKGAAASAAEPVP